MAMRQLVRSLGNRRGQSHGREMARPAGGSGPGRAAFAARLGLGAVGALAQLVERLLCKQEVTGSRPVGSTPGCHWAPPGVPCPADPVSRTASFEPAATRTVTVRPAVTSTGLFPVARVSVDGAPGLWIARGSRVVRILDRRRNVVDWRTALPGSGVLLWDRSGLALRLETTRPLAEALRVARTVG